MPRHKVRFTIWMEPEILKSAKAQAVREGVAVSEVLSAAVRAILIDADRKHTDERIVQAVERLFNLIQRTDRKRTFEQQVLKEMVGLLALSFFNHTPAVPDHAKKAALHSGQVRFNRFLDALATNLRGGRSILNDVEMPEESQHSEHHSPAAPTDQRSTPNTARPSNGVKPGDHEPKTTAPRQTLFG
jgi:hypothetical protein